MEYSHVYSEGMLARILESIEADRAERERLEKEKEKAARHEQEKAETKRRASERAEADRIAREKTDRERRAQEKIQKQKAQEDRLAKEKAAQAAQERLARDKAEAEARAVKAAEAERSVRRNLEAARRTVPAVVAPTAPPVAPTVAGRKSRWALVPGGAIVLLVTVIIYLRSNGSNQKPPAQIAQTASNRSASAAAPRRVLLPLSGQMSSGNLPATQQGKSVLPSALAPSTGARLPLPGLAQQMVGAVEILTDPRTGLMWTRKDNGSDLSWDGAQQYCAQLTLGGYSGWRLPTAEELTGIYDGQNVTGNYRFGDEVLPLHTINGFRLSKYVIWSGNGSSAGFFRFNDGQHFRVRRENLQGMGGNPALCVRSANP